MSPPPGRKVIVLEQYKEREEAKKVAYRIEFSKESGVILWLETPCGFKQPLIRWADLDRVKQFADMLLDFYHHQMEEDRMNCEKKDDEVRVVSDNLLRQALGDK